MTKMTDKNFNFGLSDDGSGTHFFYIFKSKAFQNQCRSVRQSVRPERIFTIVNLGMLELSYRFQTWHGNSCSS